MKTTHSRGSIFLDVFASVGGVPTEVLALAVPCSS